MISTKIEHLNTTFCVLKGNKTQYVVVRDVEGRSFSCVEFAANDDQKVNSRVLGTIDFVVREMPDGWTEVSTTHPLRSDKLPLRLGVLKGVANVRLGQDRYSFDVRVGSAFDREKTLLDVKYYVTALCLSESLSN